MGGLAAFPRAVGLVVLAVLFGLHLVRAALVPFTLSHAKTDLEARSLYTHANRLQPRHEVELHYADDEAIDQSYLATVVARHETCQYLLVESFEEMLDDITCTVSQKSTESVRMSMKFGDQDFLDQAREAWQRLDCSILITHHVSCNQDFKERESYKCSSWTFNAGDATAVATCEPAPFGPDSDASTSLNLKGGVIQPETAQRLRARSWPGRKRITKRAVSTYTFTLDDSWAKKEYLIGLDPLFRVSCVDCHMRGAFAVGYNFDLRTPDWGDVLLSGDAEASVEAMKEAVQKMDVRLESVQPLDTAMNFQLEVNTAVKFSWPGLMARATTTEKPTLGKKILKKGAPVVLLKVCTMSFPSVT
ncbi:MAG: hypothetical protein M1823_002726 [Watsoniomyces obsoletus]|nr:MAG: hypothetical protein M1823_002726 [Watsoniomyces obsoletus]